jgi:hypothetical protein
VRAAGWHPECRVSRKIDPMSARVNDLKPSETPVISNGDLRCHPIFTSGLVVHPMYSVQISPRARRPGPGVPGLPAIPDPGSGPAVRGPGLPAVRGPGLPAVRGPGLQLPGPGSAFIPYAPSALGTAAGDAWPVAGRWHIDPVRAGTTAHRPGKQQAQHADESHKTGRYPPQAGPEIATGHHTTLTEPGIRRVRTSSRNARILSPKVPWADAPRRT